MEIGAMRLQSEANARFGVKKNTDKRISEMKITKQNPQIRVNSDKSPAKRTVGMLDSLSPTDS